MPTGNPFGGDCPHLGGFSSSVDVVMFDSSSVLLKGGFQIWQQCSCENENVNFFA